jgi:hypothetical protein
MSKINKDTALISILGLIGIIAVIYFLKPSERTLPNYATIIGTILSLIGLTIAYVNIIALKKSAVETALKIEQALLKFNQLNSVSEISKAIKTNQEIQIFIRSGKIELAHLRTLDLKYMLLHFNSNAHLSELTNDETYQQLVIEFGIDLTSINDNLISPKRKVDFSKVTNNLEQLSTYLTQFETRIKSLNI